MTVPASVESKIREAGISGGGLVFNEEDLRVLNESIGGRVSTNSIIPRSYSLPLGAEIELCMRDNNVFPSLSSYGVLVCAKTGRFMSEGDSIQVNGFSERVYAPYAIRHYRTCYECGNEELHKDTVTVEITGGTRSYCPVHARMRGLGITNALDWLGSDIEMSPNQINESHVAEAAHTGVYVRTVTLSAASHEPNRPEMHSRTRINRIPAVTTQPFRADQGNQNILEFLYAYGWNNEPTILPNSFLSTIPVTRHGRPHDHRILLSSYSENVLSVLDGFRGAPGEIPDGDDSERLWLGVELEALPKNTAHPWYTRFAYETTRDFAILKTDASIGENGLEIVTVPGTLAWHKSGIWDAFFEKAAPHLHAWDTGVCGLHVHLNRHAMTSLVLGKMLVFLNDKKNQPFFERVAGRSANAYCAVTNKRVSQGDNPMDRNIDHNRRHHEALAYSDRNNGNSMELRIFRGNVSKNGLFRALEFSAMLPDFTSETSAAKDALTGDKFLQWFSLPRNYSRYPHFQRWARRNGLLRITAKLKGEEQEAA